MSAVGSTELTDPDELAMDRGVKRPAWSAVTISARRRVLMLQIVLRMRTIQQEGGGANGNKEFLKGLLLGRMQQQTATASSAVL